MQLNKSFFTEFHHPLNNPKETFAGYAIKVSNKLHEEQTPYQKIEIFDTPFYGRLLVFDGCIMLTDKDNFIYHEMMTHPALFTHPNPKNVVIIGGGDCGTLKEVLKHTSLQQVTQIEIDKRVTELAREFFPALCESNEDPRANLLFADGIEWMKKAEAESVDIIIVDSTDPVGAAEGLFDQAFFASCLNALKTDGLLVQQSESPFYYEEFLPTLHQRMKDSGFADAKTLFFPQPTYPSGSWSATMASKGQVMKNFREDDASSKTFVTRYYNTGIHRAALAVPEFMKC